jgi:Uma2 family endonuclease
MALSIPWARITYQDYLKLPGEQCYEVLAGELTMVPAPGAPHQVVLANLNDILRAFIKLHNLGMVLFAPLDVILAEDSVVQPDLLFIRTDRLVILTTEGVRGAPGHVVEVLSPSTADHDRGVLAEKEQRHRFSDDRRAADHHGELAR